MRTQFASALALGLLLSGAAYAQSPSSPGSASNAGSGSNAHASTQSSQQLANAQQIRQDLEKAGFTDVNIVAESFVIRAKSKSGDPVLMTIGPHSMSIFETVNAGGSSSGSNTGNASSTSGAGGAGSSGSGSKR